MDILRERFSSIKNMRCKEPSLGYDFSGVSFGTF